jgi:peptidoglycan/LPS O-acetylase OafA/YrhL
MQPSLSMYLDCVRIFSALLVFIHHASYPRFGGEWLLRVGGEAVIVFFVLSGFVVSYAAEAKERTSAQYIAGRLSRLWSVAIPAILCTILMDFIGRRIAPRDFYPSDHDRSLGLAAGDCVLESDMDRGTRRGFECAVLVTIL